MAEKLVPITARLKRRAHANLKEYARAHNDISLNAAMNDILENVRPQLDARIEVAELLSHPPGASVSLKARVAWLERLTVAIAGMEIDARDLDDGSAGAERPRGRRRGSPGRELPGEN